MPLKPRRTKSLTSLKPKKTSQWDDDDSDSDDNASSATDELLFALPNGISVRKFRRADAKAIHKGINDPDVGAGYPDTRYPQPFSLWRAHKVIDEAFDPKEYLVRHNPTSSPQDSYEQATCALAEMDLEQRLAKRRGQFFGGAPPPEKDSRPMMHTCYCVAKDDACIGLVEINVQDPVTGDPDDDDPNDPAFMHEAEICYWITAEYRNRGIITSVLPPFMQWTWDNFAHVELITAATYSTWNPASGHILRKCGFQSEGVWRGAVRKNGRIGNMSIYSAVRPGGKVEQARLELMTDWVEDIPFRTT